MTRSKLRVRTLAGHISLNPAGMGRYVYLAEAQCQVLSENRLAQPLEHGREHDDDHDDDDGGYQFRQENVGEHNTTVDARHV